MADDPDRGLDSDDMLRAAREGIAKPPPTPEDDSSKTPDVQTEATEPNLDAVESTHPVPRRSRSTHRPGGGRS